MTTNFNPDIAHRWEHAFYDLADIDRWRHNKRISAGYSINPPWALYYIACIWQEKNPGGPTVTPTELNHAVALRVMGWTAGYPRAVHQYWLLAGKDTGWLVETVPYHDVSAFEPSTDITAAWAVITAMLAKGWQYTLFSREDGDHVCEFSREYGDTVDGEVVYGETAASAPEAICMAALAAHP